MTIPVQEALERIKVLPFQEIIMMKTDVERAKEKGMPRMNQTNYADEEIGNYELDYSDDPRPIVDTKLEFEADKSGMIHVRKHVGESQVLQGYGTTDFGISPFEEKPLVSSGNVILASGLAAAGFLTWKFRDTIATGLMSLVDYALILRESRSEEMTDQP